MVSNGRVLGHRLHYILLARLLHLVASYTSVQFRTQAAHRQLTLLTGQSTARQVTGTQHGLLTQFMGLVML